MKRLCAVILAILALTVFTACSTRQVPQSFENADAVLEYMLKGNADYVKQQTNAGNVSQEKRIDTAVNGQNPYAVVITCSDSRAPAEHIFSAGIGELFVIRTAGNVIGDFELGSVEYGAEHLGTKLILVLGHTDCGAVKAALSGEAHGNIKKITDEINSCLTPGVTAREAEKLNVQNSISRIMASPIMQHLVSSEGCKVVGAIYNISTGLVEVME